MKTTLILHNIRSVYNVGSIIRTADALGVDKIYLSGYTPAPKDKFGRWRKDFHKSALGAEKSIDWEHSKRAGQAIEKLKKEGFYIVAIEQAPKSKDYKKVKVKKKTAFLLGNEVRGLSKQILDRVDVVAEIPMRGEKESLNVSVAAGIALSRMLNK